MALTDEQKQRPNGLTPYAPNPGPAGYNPQPLNKPATPAVGGIAAGQPNPIENLSAVRSANADDVRALNAQGKTAQAIGASMRGDLASGAALAVDIGKAFGRVTAPVVDGVSGFARGLVGWGDSSKTPSPAAPTRPATPATPATPAPVQANPTDQRLTAGTQTMPGATPVPGATAAPSPAPAPSPASGGNVITYDPATKTYSGTNVGADAQWSGSRNGTSTSGGGGYATVPSASGLMGYQGAAGIGSTAGTAGARGIGGLGLQTSMGDFQSADNAIRAANIRDGLPVNAGLDGFGPRGYVIGGAARGIRLAPGANAEYQSIERRRREMAGEDPASLQRAAALQLEQTRQAAEMARTGLTAQVQAQHNLAQQRLDQQRLDDQLATSKVQRLGLDADAVAKKQQADLRGVLLDPNATPEAKKEAQVALLAIQGKQENAHRYTVVPGGQQIDQLSGKAYTVPSQVLDNQSGQFVQPQGKGAAGNQDAPADASKRSVGTVYLLPNGKNGRWTGQGWELVS